LGEKERTSKQLKEDQLEELVWMEQSNSHKKNGYQEKQVKSVNFQQAGSALGDGKWHRLATD